MDPMFGNVHTVKVYILHDVGFLLVFKTKEQYFLKLDGIWASLRQLFLWAIPFSLNIA